ncbi:lipoate--protein ligase family protein [Calidifontibacillus erzurumensis]|uniref:Octanoyl-[GcvH]:protein N-octanoyltransferase n=1 Tax=Calidifontibacillus erzurumensis TaxID=2741433 RepID=A0A8J8GGC4_9BACI|nr:lipoate--protein ligase family protein [Calidifontibacillus erzurumensis]NSL52979.1 lipoate--protein ligase family protein [Calidifontibacillus erzurumensis]
MTTEIHPLLEQKEWRFVDHSRLGLEFSALQSFAYDDTFCTSVGAGKSAPVVRVWVHKPTVVLGIQDGRLPYLDEGIHFLEQLGFQTIIRNSGGLAVILDEEILNVSLIWPEGKGIEINRGYEAMWQLVQLTMRTGGFHVPIEAREIVGSYCPGSFDLSIDNKKFAGISQRRLRGGVAVQIYLCVAASGSKRAEIIKEFYERALQGINTKFSYPKIIPATMASLSELLHTDITTNQMKNYLLEALQNIGEPRTPIRPSTSLNEYEQELFHYHYERLLKRNFM